MKIRNGWQFEKTNEDYKTALMSVALMPPTARFTFMKSVAGQEFLKGIQMVAENNKPANKEFGMSWDASEIDELVQAVIKADYNDAELIMSLLPGPVAAIVHDRLNAHKQTPQPYSEWTKVKGSEVRGDIKKSFITYKEVMEYAKKGKKKLEKGARKGTPGYEKWLSDIRAHRISKVGPDAKTRPTKYRHFLRRVKPDTGKIVDKPVSDNSKESKDS